MASNKTFHSVTQSLRSMFQDKFLSILIMTQRGLYVLKSEMNVYRRILTNDHGSHTVTQVNVLTQKYLFYHLDHDTEF